MRTSQRGSALETGASDRAVEWQQRLWQSPTAQPPGPILLVEARTFVVVLVAEWICLFVIEVALPAVAVLDVLLGQS